MICSLINKTVFSGTEMSPAINDQGRTGEPLPERRAAGGDFEVISAGVCVSLTMAAFVGLPLVRFQNQGLQIG